jgi:GTP cyclohydrolase IV
MTNSTQTIAVTSRDAQAETPATRVSLSRVGVVGIEKIIRVCGTQNGGPAGDESLYHADLECFVDLNPEQAGVHMSRFEEVINEAIDTVVLGEALRA